MKVRGIIGSALLAGVACNALAAPAIRWQPWQRAAFEHAKAENRMLVIDVGIEGCTACRRMDEITYTHEDVVALINQHFVAIAVDAEARPDLGERYADWAWPATIFLAPDTTQVLALRGNRLPRNFIPILAGLIEKHQTGGLEPDELAPYAAAPAPAVTELTRMRDQVRAQLDRQLNEEHGGWQQRAVSTAGGARLRHLFLRAHMYDNAQLRDLALLTADGYLRALDPVWGGVFVNSFHDGVALPEALAALRAIPEKRISNQADALLAFADAYAVTGDSKYLQGIRAVDGFIRDWFMASDGTFFTSQEDAAPRLPDDMTSVQYWTLGSDAERRRFGIPPIDHGVYTDKNGEVITAYATVYEVTGDAHFLSVAVKAAQALLDTRLQDAGWMLQTLPNEHLARDKRMRPLALQSRPYLSAQAWFGTALLALYRASGDEQWLSRAVTVGEAMLAHLGDAAIGGFSASTPDDAAGLMAPRKPLEHNATAARLFYDLWVYTKDMRYAALPERTLRAVARPEAVRREGKIVGELALALEKLTAAYVEISVVGDPTDARAAALHAAGRELYQPRKLLHFERPGRYPDRGRPTLYICNPDFCTAPIEDPSDVAAQAEVFRRPAASQTLTAPPPAG